MHPHLFVDLVLEGSRSDFGSGFDNSDFSEENRMGEDELVQAKMIEYGMISPYHDNQFTIKLRQRFWISGDVEHTIWPNPESTIPQLKTQLREENNSFPHEFDLELLDHPRIILDEELLLDREINHLILNNMDP
ncbi:hypothetical protein ACFE04_011755 [Oxalis oulophora]